MAKEVRLRHLELLDRICGDILGGSSDIFVGDVHPIEADARCASEPAAE